VKGPERAGAAPGDADDASLARRARGGDERAFATLVERYQGPSFNFAYRLLGDYDDAVEAAQQGFVQLYTSLPTLDLDRPLRPWLFRTIRNRCIDLLRQRRTGGRGISWEGEAGEAGPAERLADPAPLPDEVLERADLQNLLVAAIRRLPAHFREVVALRYTTDLTFAEIGAVLGVPENTAKIHFHRAKARLREALRDLSED
jgi:RNA polymerase sigma-70 factor (ECF subfamily)